MLMVAAPLVRAVALEVYPPPDRVTEPVAGVVPPETVIATDSEALAEMVPVAGETVTLGVVFGGGLLPPPQPITVNAAAVMTSSTLRILRPRRQPSGRKKNSSAA